MPRALVDTTVLFAAAYQRGHLPGVNGGVDESGPVAGQQGGLCRAVSSRREARGIYAPRVASSQLFLHEEWKKIDVFFRERRLKLKQTLFRT